MARNKNSAVLERPTVERDPLDDLIDAAQHPQPPDEHDADALGQQIGEARQAASEVSSVANHLKQTDPADWTPGLIEKSKQAQRDLPERLRELLVLQRQFLPAAQANDAAENAMLREQYAAQWPDDMRGSANQVIEAVALEFERIGFSKNYMRVPGDRAPEFRALVAQHFPAFQEAVRAEQAYFHRPPCPVTTANVDRARYAIESTEAAIKAAVDEL
jgi:hypothetical protein